MPADVAGRVITRSGQHDQPLITMNVAVFRAVSQPQVGRNRDLECPAVMVVDFAALVAGVFVFAMRIVMIVAWLPARQLIHEALPPQ